MHATFLLKKCITTKSHHTGGTTTSACPIQNNKYVTYYNNFFNKNLRSNEIEVIYIIKSKPNENIKIEQFKILLDNICFKTEVINELLSIHEIQSCN